MLKIPSKILEIVEHQNELAVEMFDSLIYKYLTNKNATAVAYWSDRFVEDNPKYGLQNFNRYVFHLVKSGWVITNIKPKRHWGEMYINEEKLLTKFSKEELDMHSISIRFNRSTMDNKKLPDTSHLTKTSKGISDVGHRRPHTFATSHIEFSYDRESLKKYYDVILENVTKGLSKANIDINPSDYTNISKYVINNIIEDDSNTYCMNGSINDSRARNIYKATRKIFNPITYKDARAAYVIKDGEPLSKKGETAVKLAVAELLGIKRKNNKLKALAGYKAILNRTLPKLSEDYSNLHNIIWLERIYDNWDNKSNWVVPIELDFTSSIIAIIGLLLNHYDYLDFTNLTNPEELKDAWTIEGLTRKQVKSSATPKLYGSSESTENLWKHRNLDYTKEQVVIMDKEIKSGRFALANKFKEFIVRNVEPKSTMEVHVWNETFTVHCNRFSSVGEYCKKYMAFDSNTDSMQMFINTKTKKVDDLEQFKLYFQTLLVHGIDSQIAENVCSTGKVLLSVFDAFMIHPNHKEEVSDKVVESINEIRDNGESIINNYLRSLGLKKNHKWLEVEKLINRKECKLYSTVLK
jgi:hypothetical protein